MFLEITNREKNLDSHSTTPGVNKKSFIAIHNLHVKHGGRKMLK